MKMADIEARQPGTMCDFCSESLGANPKEYHAEKRAITPLEDGFLCDDGVWLACSVCAELKDANKWEELLTRCAELLKNDPMPSGMSYEENREALKLVWHMAFGVQFN